VPCAGEECREQSACDGQADALGLRSAGKGGEVVLLEDDRVLEGFLELGNLGAELGVSGLEGGIDGGSLEGSEQLLRIAVECLSGALLLLGASGDLTVRAVEDGGGIGDAELGR
jgi:hypothetical protein